jgi:predicted transcriptional regulator
MVANMKREELDDIPEAEIEAMRPSPAELGRIGDPVERLLRADHDLLVYKRALELAAATRRLTAYHLIEEREPPMSIGEVATLLRTSSARVSQLLSAVRKELGLPPHRQNGGKQRGVRAELMELLRDVADDDPRLPLIALAMGENPDTIRRQPQAALGGR